VITPVLENPKIAVFSVSFSLLTSLKRFQVVDSILNDCDDTKILMSKPYLWDFFELFVTKSVIIVI
jgi:hypothetical protein